MTGPTSDPEAMRRDLGLLVDQAARGWSPRTTFWPHGGQTAPSGTPIALRCSAGTDRPSTTACCRARQRAARAAGRPGWHRPRRAPPHRAARRRSPRAFIGHVEPTFDWTIRLPWTRQHFTESTQAALYDGLCSGEPVGRYRRFVWHMSRAREGPTRSHSPGQSRPSNRRPGPYRRPVLPTRRPGPRRHGHPRRPSRGNVASGKPSGTIQPIDGRACRRGPNMTVFGAWRPSAAQHQPPPCPRGSLVGQPKCDEDHCSPVTGGISSGPVVVQPIAQRHHARRQPGGISKRCTDPASSSKRQVTPALQSQATVGRKGRGGGWPRRPSSGQHRRLRTGRN